MFNKELAERHLNDHTKLVAHIRKKNPEFATNSTITFGSMTSALRTMLEHIFHCGGRVPSPNFDVMVSSDTEVVKLVAAYCFDLGLLPRFSGNRRSIVTRLSVEDSGSRREVSRVLWRHVKENEHLMEYVAADLHTPGEGHHERIAIP